MAEWNIMPYFVMWWILSEVFAMKSKPPPSSKLPPSVILSNGVEMPAIGISTWEGFSSKILSASDIKPVNPLLKETLHRAIDYGYRLFDAAAFDGDSESIVSKITRQARVIAASLAEAEKNITRRDFFISTKLSSYSHKYQEVVPELQESLDRLNLEYVDLYLMHLPFALLLANKVDDSIVYTETWRGMEDALQLNLTRSVGVAHADPRMLRTLLRSRVKPHVLQIEMNLNLQQGELVALCSRHGVAVVAAGALGSLLAAERALAAAPLPRWDDPVLAGFGNKYGKTVPQIALRFLIENNVVPLILPRSYYQLQESLDIFDFKLQAFEMFLLKSFHNGFRTLDFKYWSHAKYYPFKGDKPVKVRDKVYPGDYNIKIPIYRVTAKTVPPPIYDI